MGVRCVCYGTPFGQKRDLLIDVSEETETFIQMLGKTGHALEAHKIGPGQTMIVSVRNVRTNEVISARVTDDSTHALTASVTKLIAGVVRKRGTHNTK